MEQIWMEFVESLPPAQRLRLVREMGLSIPGFRKEAKVIPEPKVLQVLKDAPARGRGKPFIQWFSGRHSELMGEIASKPEEELVELRAKWLEDYPTSIVEIALLLSGDKGRGLYEQWDEFFQESAEAQTKTIESEPSNASNSKMQSLEKRLTQLEERLSELEDENRSLRQQNKKLKHQESRLKSQVAKMGKDNEERLAKERERTVEWQQRYEERVNELKEKEAAAERVTHLLHSAQKDAAEQAKLLTEAQKGLASARSSAAEMRKTLRIYQAAMGTGEVVATRGEIKVLVIGEAFQKLNLSFGGKRFAVEGIEAGQDEAELAQICQEYDRIVMLSLCHHRTRVQIYRICGMKLKEIPSILCLREALMLEEDLHREHA